MDEQNERAPLLDESQNAEWVVVDAQLVSWARRVSHNREVIGAVYGTRNRKTINFVPCEEDTCRREMQFGSRILRISWKKKGVTGKGDRVFCSVDCQRKNRLESLVVFHEERREKAKNK